VTLELFRIFVRFPLAHLDNIHVEETGNNSFTYFNPQQAERQEAGAATGMMAAV
jgi:hypothetical protein